MVGLGCSKGRLRKRLVLREHGPDQPVTPAAVQCPTLVFTEPMAQSFWPRLRAKTFGGGELKGRRASARPCASM